MEVGDVVWMDEMVYGEPYRWVSDIQMYDDLDRLYYHDSLDIDFPAWLQSLRLTVTKIEGEFVYAETEMLFQKRTFVFYPEELHIDEERSRPERQKRKNVRLEKAGQLRLF